MNGVKDLLKVIGLVLILGSQNVAAEQLTADNFVLIDHQGTAHELYYHRDAKTIVLMVHGNGCQIVRSNLTEMKQLRDDYSNKGVEFMMINSNMQDTRQAIAEEAEEWGVDMPILHDRTQIIGKSLKLVRTGEVLVINPQNWKVVYRGALSDRVDYERQKAQTSKHYVRDALDAVIVGTEVQLAEVVSPGCIINYDNDEAEISYSKTIAPILKENCVACHIKGGIAPWAMTEFAMVKGFAPMIREVLRTKRMPPWHLDPEVGHWQNDKSLSDVDKTTLINWIESGAPRGDGNDPLKDIGVLENVWTLGEPDLILDIPAFEVPANGIVDYQFPNVANPLDKDVWVVAAAIIPGDPQAVHHILAGSSDKPLETDDIENIFKNFILTYAPGNESAYMPEGTGVFVPKGGVYQFQMHYTPYGKASVDRSKIGLYFADKPPTNFFREHVLVNTEFKIPAHAESHEEHAYFQFSRDATIYAFFPHSHYRGKSSTFELIHNDGTTELILSVPNYDFNWQRTYSLKEPKKVKAGTKIVHRTIYNNSAKNRSNPNPNEDVYWGLQSEEEMLYGSMSFSWDEETTAKPIHKGGLTRLFQAMGSMDRNIDDRVTELELPEDIRSFAHKKWSTIDKDADGGLDMQELGNLFAAIKKARKEARNKSSNE